MKYRYRHNRMVSNEQRKLLLIGVPSLAMLILAYVLVTALSPTLVTVPFANTSAITEQRLKSRPGEHGDRLFIPQINIDLAIVSGVDGSVLDKGAWHRSPQNGDPVKGGNFALSARRFVMGFTPSQTRAQSPFFNLDRLQLGDQLFVDYKGGRYGYRISRKYSGKLAASQIAASSQKPIMTIFSCTADGAADGHDVIEATPIGKVNRIDIAK